MTVCAGSRRVRRSDRRAPWAPLRSSGGEPCILFDSRAGSAGAWTGCTDRGRRSMVVETGGDSVPILPPARLQERIRWQRHWALTFAPSLVPGRKPKGSQPARRGRCAHELRTRQVRLRRPETPASDSGMLETLRPEGWFYPVHLRRPPEARRKSQHPLSSGPWSAC